MQHRGWINGIVAAGVMVAVTAGLICRHRPSQESGVDPGTVRPGPMSPALADVPTPMAPIIQRKDPPIPDAATGPVQAVAADPSADLIRHRVAALADASRPEPERLAEITTLAKAGDAASLGVLMAAGESGIYLAPTAIEAVGAVRSPAVTAFLGRMREHPEAKHVVAAIRALSRHGESAVPAIAETLLANRTRPDGHEDLIGAACVQALADTGSATAVPVLARQLTEVVGTSLSHDHGMKVVDALATLRAPAGIPALTCYVERLRRERQAMTDNPMGRTYLDGLIERTTVVIRALTPRNTP